MILFQPYTAGYIRPDGSTIILNEYHGEDEALRDKKYIEFSNTHPEEDTCIRIFIEPSLKQYNTLHYIIDKYLDQENYCKIEIEKDFYEIYSLYDGACEYDSYEENVGNWTADKLIQIIKNYYKKKTLSEDINISDKADLDNFKEWFDHMQEHWYDCVYSLKNIHSYVSDRFSVDLDIDEILGYILELKEQYAKYSELPIIATGNEANTIFIGRFDDLLDRIDYIIKNSDSVVSFYIYNELTEKFELFIDAKSTSITAIIPDSMKDIPNYLFSARSWLNAVYIKSGVESIGKQSFSFCDNLTSVIIPKSVVSIDEKAFLYSEDIVFRCEDISKPITWPNGWNNYCKVIWGEVIK